MKRFFALLFIVLTMAACGAAPQPTPTPRPTATATVLVLTATPTATLTAEATPTLVVQSAGVAAPGTWTDMNSQTGKFIVTVPGNLSEQVQTVNTLAGSVQLHLYGLNRGDIYYAVAYSDYPEEMIQESKPNDVLNGAVKGALANTNGKLLSSVLGQMQNVPGVEFKGEIPPRDGQNPSASIQGRMFLKGPRLYQVFCIVSTGKEAPAQIDRFLNSFRFATD